MKRLIYAPKAYIFIRSSNLGGRIYDVSSDVVSGEVTQNCGDVSKASFQLRNRYQKWLRDDPNSTGVGPSIFLPMDMVTIWLQRVAGRPVQVFTGYLDSVPYYQGYPGNAIFEATCTLKKLAYTWFDPGLAFFQQWVMSTGGWKYDPTSGEAQNPRYLSEWEMIQPNAALTAQGALAKIHDGGFAELLGRFMVEVAGWDSNDVLIAEMNPDLPKLAAKLYSDIHNRTEDDLHNLQEFLGQIMGIKGWASPNGATTAEGTPAQQAAITPIIETIKGVAGRPHNNIPPLVPLFAAFVQTSFNEKFAVDANEGRENWGYGLYALQPKNTVDPVPGITSDPLFAAPLVGSDIDGKTPDQLLDAAVATDVFCKRLKRYPQYAQAALNDDLATIKQWIEAALGRPLPKVDLATLFNKVQRYNGVTSVVLPTSSAISTVDASTFDFKNKELQRYLTAREKQVIRDNYKGAHAWLAAILYRAKQASSTLTISPPSVSSAAAITITGPVSALNRFFDDLTGDQSIESVEVSINGSLKRLQKGSVSTVHRRHGSTNNTMLVLQPNQPPKQQTPTGGDSPPTPDPNQLQGGATFVQLAAFSANAAFAANFAFPTNILESTNLGGDKALMNDVSCLDAVKQFTKASLRTFRSLPDGRFLAFYPDYFGAYRKPYWQIHNIEITNFGIQLNDQALATHVYVTGDAAYQDGKIDFNDRIASRGVATITQAFMLNSFIEPYTPPADRRAKLEQPRLGRLTDAYSFLQHYGARPYKEEQPLIRNTFYEFLMSWQRFMQLWAQQFATQVSFTFQPEVMAGGLVAFPDHDIQMYCESVTHQFDYASSFNTSAVMTAPSLLSERHDRTHKPGFALAGNVNTVGAA